MERGSTEGNKRKGETEKGKNIKRRERKKLQCAREKKGIGERGKTEENAARRKGRMAGRGEGSACARDFVKGNR